MLFRMSSLKEKFIRLNKKTLSFIILEKLIFSTFSSSGSSSRDHYLAMFACILLIFSGKQKNGVRFMSLLERGEWWVSGGGRRSRCPGW